MGTGVIYSVLWLGKSPPLPEFDGKFAATEQVLGKKIDDRFAVI